MWDDKEFQLRCDSWDVRRESVARNRERGRVAEIAPARGVLLTCACVRRGKKKTRPHFRHIASNCLLIEQIVDTGSNTQRSHV